MTSRAAFEAAMRAEGWNKSLATWSEDRQCYDSFAVQNMWQGWQLCLRRCESQEKARHPDWGWEELQHE